MAYYDTLIRNARILSGGNETILRDILIANGRIAAITEPGDICFSTAQDVIDADGNLLLHGFVDLHVHFREPGYEYKETILSGSQAAAAGGFTTVCTMPNLNPAPDTFDHLREQLNIIKSDADIEVIPYATITLNRKGKECVDFRDILSSGIKYGSPIAGFSDDGNGVQDEDVMRRALESSAKEDFMIAAHCEVNSLLRGGYIHDGEWCKVHRHDGICSESEWKEVERDIKLAEETGGRLHICHVSTKESVELVRKAKERGVRVTCETGPHYLVFSDKDMQEDGRFKMNPPLRSEEDRQALRRGIADGTIDAIATDHAPHSADEKSRGLAKSAMGIVGLETAFPAVYTYCVKEGLITLEEAVERMTVIPQKILGRESSTKLRRGDIADLVLIDTETEFKVNPEKFLSKGKSTPFAGKKLFGRPMMTMKDGSIVYLYKDTTKPEHRPGHQKFTIIYNERIARKTYKMVLEGDTREFSAPGQFVNIEIPGKFLRRPISVADYYINSRKGRITLLYDVVGEGTKIMSEMSFNDKVDILTALGNGFDLKAPCEHPVLLGGGIGAAPMLGLARELKKVGKDPIVMLGFNTKEDIILEEQFQKLGIKAYYATADGTFGEKGFVTDLYRKICENLRSEGLETPDYFYACGPNPMLKAVCGQIDIPGEVSLDERMGCGFGTCMCCSVHTTEGAKRTCTDGPVFKKETVIF